MAKDKKTTPVIEASAPVALLDMVKDSVEGTDSTQETVTGAELQGNEGTLQLAEQQLPEGTVLAQQEEVKPEVQGEELQPAAGTHDKLAAMLANATNQAQQQNADVAPNTTKPATPRTAATTRKIQSARSTDAQGNKVRRFNSTETRRQIVSIVSEMGKLAHITTDINYAVRTPEAAKAKAYAELVKQQEIKAICAFPDIVVHVTAEDYSINPLPGHDLAECQEAKTAMYDQWQAKGYTMLGRVRRSKMPATMPAAVAQQQAQVAGAAEPAAAALDLKAAIQAAKEAKEQETQEVQEVQEQQVDTAGTDATDTAEKEAVSE